MLYLDIDQHAKQITVCVRDESGDIVLRRQVSTRRPEKIEAFFQQLSELDTEFMAIPEVCGFNDWLIDTLRKQNCREIVLIHKPSTGTYCLNSNGTSSSASSLSTYEDAIISAS